MSETVPFFRPQIGELEIAEVAATLRSGWITTGPKTRAFEQRFAAAVGAPHALGLGSCTAALHLALAALEVRRGDVVLVPTMTFAATAEVVRHVGAEPVLVDCEEDTLLMDLDDARRRAQAAVERGRRVACILPVHVSGVMVDMVAARRLARELGGARLVDDAAHAFPAAWRESPAAPWRTAGCGDADVTCYSFYANKTITTGEGGMAVCHDAELDARMRRMSLHGISRAAWDRAAGRGAWYYEIAEAGFKYNMSDIQAAIGIHQLARAEAMRDERAEIDREYRDALEACDELELPPLVPDRKPSFHLFYVRLRLDRLTIDRAEFIEELGRAGVGTSVHWMPLHLHPFYRDGWGLTAEDYPAATAVWRRLVSLPIFSGMSREERRRVIAGVLDACRRHRRSTVEA